MSLLNRVLSTGRSHRVAMVWAIGALVALVCPRLAGATTAADVCPPAADPCTVTSDVPVTDGSTLDFGARALVVNRFKHLDVGGGSMTIRVRSIEVEPGGGIIAVTDTTGGVITI